MGSAGSLPGGCPARWLPWQIRFPCTPIATPYPGRNLLCLCSGSSWC